MKKVIAVDLGASNGRLMLATWNGKKIHMEELHRFPNEPTKSDKHLFWDIPFIMNEIKSGFKKYVQKYGDTVDGIGIDTWGVDFGLIAEEDELLENPYCYRDTHTIKIMDEVHQKISNKKLFIRTGVETASINTIYQLYAIMNKNPAWLDRITAILMLPNLIAYMLTGEKFNEYTHASTTQMLNWETQDWDQEIMEYVFSRNIPLAKIKQTNTILARTTLELRVETGLAPSPVINIPGHDTACALAAMPLQSKDTVFMSCGTWVLIGIETENPIVSDKAFRWGFTNEGTLEKTYRLQKNNMGLWLLQQCKKEWEELGEAISYEEEDNLIENAKPFQSLINPDQEMFFNPVSMTGTIREFCKKSNQKLPQTKGEIIRCILESLALKYRWVIERLQTLTKREIPSIHMGGGGIQNKALCQFTASATNRSVRSGPIEASALGNALSQFIAIGEFADLKTAREAVNGSFQTIDYHPMNIAEWDQAYSRFLKLL